MERTATPAPATPPDDARGRRLDGRCPAPHPARDSLLTQASIAGAAGATETRVSQVLGQLRAAGALSDPDGWRTDRRLVLQLLGQ